MTPYFLYRYIMFSPYYSYGFSDRKQLHFIYNDQLLQYILVLYQLILISM